MMLVILYFQFQTYQFNVIVDDTKFSNTATVTVTVTDVNDNSPVVGNYNFNNFTENDPSVVGVIATVSVVSGSEIKCLFSKPFSLYKVYWHFMKHTNNCLFHVNN
jgi:hypothetical protein